MSLAILFLVINFILISANSEMDFDVDYYFATSLRSNENCDHLSKLYCQLHCKNDNGMCLSGKCYCMDIKEAADENSLPKMESEDDLKYAFRPTVRHHIAHFCPNLDVARTCIRKCMKLGLPAFCGKDHVCYCGHKYKNTDINHKVNAEEVYNQFKDLYTKYFGPNVAGKDELVEIK